MTKLEQENKDLRLQKDPKQEIKKLETEIAFLKTELETHTKSANAKKVDVSIIKKELTLEEQMRIQRELA